MYVVPSSDVRVYVLSQTVQAEYVGRGWRLETFHICLRGTQPCVVPATLSTVSNPRTAHGPSHPIINPKNTFEASNDL